MLNLRHSSKKSLIKNIIQLGIVLLVEILVHTSHMKQSISFISIWDKLPFSSLKVDENYIFIYKAINVCRVFTLVYSRKLE